MSAVQHGTGISLAKFVKATIVGGLLFLLPLILIVVLLTHAMKFAGKVAHPIAKALKLDTVIGTDGEIALAVVVLLVISLAAGLFARTRAGRTAMRWAETSVLGGLPQYQLIKSVAEGLAQVEGAEG